MAQYSQPTKKQVREYMEQRQASGKPPPEMKEIRRQLGWDLIEMRRNGTLPRS